MVSSQVPEGYKQTEIGVIPEDWDVRCLGEVGQSLIGLTYRPEDTRDHGTLVLRSSNVQNDRLAYENNVYVDSSLPLPSRVIVEEGDILICVRNGSKQLIGKCALIDAEAAGSAFGAFMSVFRTKISSFVFYQFQSDVIQTQINEIMGATINQITNKDMAAFQIPLPPSDKEQRTIAQALSDVDALISSLDKIIAKKRHLKIATMQQLLTGKKRLPGFGKGEWVKKQQKEVCSYINGRAYQRVEWETYGTPVVRLQNLTGSGDEYYYSNLILPEHQYMNYGDLIFMWSASFGPYIWKGRKSIYHYHIWKINCDLEKVDKTFYCYKLLELTENIKQGSNGSTMAHVTKGEMENFSITLPEDTEEQRAIATVLSDMDTEIAALETRRAKTQAIKQGMMQELLTGKTRLV